MLCVATVAEALTLRAALPEPRILVLGPTATDDLAAAREARLELTHAGGAMPEGIPIHVKLETGMGRWGLSELPAATGNVVGVMTHLATADSDLSFAREQLERFRAATAALTGVTRHAANSAGALRLPESRFDAARCGIALYGLSPFGEDPAADGLEPVLGLANGDRAGKVVAGGSSRPATGGASSQRRTPGSGSCRSGMPTAFDAI